jgi:hypothetical protein
MSLFAVVVALPSYMLKAARYAIRQHGAIFRFSLTDKFDPGLSFSNIYYYYYYYYLNLFNHGGLSVVCFSKGRAYKNIACVETNTIIIYKISLYIYNEY